MADRPDVVSDTATDRPASDDERTRELEGASAGPQGTFCPRPGEHVGRYVILRELGAGGMSVVHVAYDPNLDRQIALKLVRRGGVAPSSAPRLQREARALARLSHPNVVHVYDVGTFADSVYIAMELIDGKTLRQWLTEDEPGWREVLAVLLEAGEGLAAAHDAGLVHFDFKPSNVLIGSIGERTTAGRAPARVRVVDFGLAREPRIPSDAAPAADPTPPRRDSEPLTEAGAVMGTPGYIAPEHLAGKEADARADQFGFCVTLWQGLYGEPPFVGGDRAGLQREVLAGRIMQPSDERGVPPRIQQVLRRGLSAAPEDRWPSLRELLVQLRRDPSAGRRRLAIALAAATTGAAGVIAIAYVIDSRGIDCDAGRDRLAQSWDQAARDEASAAFGATRLSYADAAWAKASADLDDYAQAWGELHVDACEATHARGEQSSERLDRRMACLHRARLEFAALVDLFRTADADLVRNAVVAAQSLTPISRCADAAALDPSEPPSDPAQAQQVEALEEALARGEALHAAGRYEDAVREAEQRLAEAEALGHAPVIHSAATLLGSVSAYMGRRDEALAAHGRALEVAEQAGMDAARALSLTELTHVHANLTGDLGWARWFARQAHAVHERIDAGPLERAHLASSEAVLMTMSGQIDEALALTRRAVSLRAEAGLGEDTNHATLLANLGGALYSAGRYEEALVQYREALRIHGEQLGQQHPALGVSLANLANALQALERYDEALQAHRTALALLRANDVQGPTLATQLGNEAVALFEMGRYDDAREIYGEAIAVWRAGDSVHPGYGVGLLNLAELDARQGRLDAARAGYEEALRVLEGGVGAEHPWRALASTGLAAVLVEQGEFERALVLARRAREIHRDNPTDPLFAAESDLHFGRAQWEAEPERRAEARDLVLGAEAVLARHGRRARASLKLARAWLRSHPAT